MKYGNRSFWKKAIASPLTLVIALILCVVLVNANRNIYDKVRSSKERLVAIQLKLAESEARKAELADKVAYLSTERGLETEIRTKFHAVKEGESVAVIIDEAKTAAVLNASETQATTTSSGWWKRVLRIFGFQK